MAHLHKCSMITQSPVETKGQCGFKSCKNNLKPASYPSTYAQLFVYKLTEKTDSVLSKQFALKKNK